MPNRSWLEARHPPNLFSQLQLESCLDRHIIADIRDPHVLLDAVKTCNPQAVFHLAAQPLVRRSYRDPVGTWATNVKEVFTS